MVLSLLVALASMPSGPGPHGTPPDLGATAVVAVVRNPIGSPARIVTLTRLVEEARIVLVSRGAGEAAFRPQDPRPLRATLDGGLGKTSLADLAAFLRVAEVSREQTAAELERLRERLPDAASNASVLASAEHAGEAVSTALGRRLRVDRHLENRMGRGAARKAAPDRVGEERSEEAVRERWAELRGRADLRVRDAELRGPPQAGEGN